MHVANAALPVIRRFGLLSRMAEDIDSGRTSIVLTAPAGSGKSTLLAQWVDLRLHDGDLVVELDGLRTRAVGLWPAVARAFRAALDGDDSRRTAGALRQLGKAGFGDADESLARTVDDLGRPVWIVLDDAHDMVDVDAAEALHRLLATAGSSLRVAVGSRTSPPGLTTLLVAGRASEYRFADLAFDRPEAEALLDAHRVRLADDDMSTLLARTEGWPVAVRMAAMALEGTDRPGDFVATFADDDRTVADYLVTEILNRTRADMLDVLLAVSVAEEVDAELGHALSGRSDAGAILDALVRSNALTERVPHRPGWYRCHPLLRSYLQAESVRRSAHALTLGHTRAAVWFDRAGDGATAIRHAIGAMNWRLVDDLVGRYGTRLLLTDGPEVVGPLVTRLPAYVQSRPSVAAVAGLSAASAGDMASARLHLALADAISGPIEALRTALDAVITVRDSRQSLLDTHARADALATMADASAGYPDLMLLARASYTQDLIAVGLLDDADAELAALSQVAMREGFHHLRFECLALRATLAASRCDLVRVETVATEAMSHAMQHGWHRSPWLAAPLIGLGYAAWQRGDRAAVDHATAAAAIAHDSGDPVVAAMTAGLVEVMASPAGAPLEVATVGRLRSFTDYWAYLAPAAVALTCGFHLEIALRARHLEFADDVARRAAARLGDVPDVAVFRALLHVHHGRDDLARRSLHRVLNGSRTCLAPTSTIQGWALEARLSDGDGRPEQAHAALMKAVELAEAHGVMRSVIDVPGVRSLLARARGRFGRLEEFVERMLGIDDESVDATSAGGQVDDMLTDRELAVLRDLPSLMSLREIADAHVVSINTIKTHLKAVYRKLGVTNRREAVEQARELGLI